MMSEPGLGKYIDVLKRRWWIVLFVTSLSAVASVAFALSQTESYESEAKLLARPDSSPSLTGLDESGLDSVGELRSIGRLSDPVMTIVESMRSHNLISQVISSTNLRDQEGNLLKSKDLLQKLEIKPVAGSDIIGVRFIHEDPIVAANVVNSVAEVYIASNLQRNQSKTSEAKKFIENSLPKVKDNLLEAERAYTKFREDNRISSLEDESHEIIKLISSLEDKLVNNQTDLALASETANKLSIQLGLQSNTALDSVNLSQTPGIQTLVERKHELEGELDTALTKYQENHPLIISISQEIGATNARLQKLTQNVLGGRQPLNIEADVQMGRLEQQLSAELIQAELERDSLNQEYVRINQLIALNRERLDNLPKLQQQHDELERNKLAAQNTYESLLQRLQEIQVAENQQVGGVSLLSHAIVADESIPSKKPHIIMMGILLGIISSTALAFLIDLLDTSLRNFQDICQSSKYPVRGIIPNKLSKENLLLNASNSNFSYEKSKQLKKLRSSYLGMANKLNRNSKFILTAAPSPKDQSGLAALNLAFSVAENCKRVIFVSFDCEVSAKSSGQNHLLQHIPSMPVDKISENVVRADDFVEGPFRYLSMLRVSGLESMDDFSGGGIKRLLDHLAGDYDLVIVHVQSVDSCECYVTSAGRYDDILLIADPSQSGLQDLEALSSVLENRGSKTFGVILNNVKNVHHLTPRTMHADTTPQVLTRLVVR